MRNPSLDICECGDYRHQHDGVCLVCGLDDTMNGRACLMFRLHLKAELTWRIS